MNRRNSLTGGMAEAIPSDLVGQDSAALIENMKFGKDFVWHAVRVPADITAASQLPAYTWEWIPVYLPDGCTGDRVYVSFSDNGDLSLTYKKTAGYYTTANLLTGIDSDNVRVGSDPQQFIFLDGREGIGTYRITIDEDGAIACRPFGTQQPIIAPVVSKIECERYEGGKYTGVPVGSILFYAYCIVNKFGERSNPSPVAVIDTAQWFAKGSINETDYVYTEDNQGSIKTVSVLCDIPVPAEAKRVELYRTSAEYHESLAPLDPAMLVKSVDLTQEQDSVVITDASFISPIVIDYENDVAPAGDDLVLESGRIFIANSVSPKTFPVVPEMVWSIRITNPNPVSYVNRWISIDIREDPCDVAIDVFAGMKTGYLQKSILYDSDMVTPLEAFYVKNGTGDFIDLTSVIDGTIKAWLLTHIRIPYIPAASEKTIFLVYTKDVTTYSPIPYPTEIDPASSASVLAFRDKVLDNPVRDEKCIVATGTSRDILSVNGWQKNGGNKANALIEYTGTALRTGHYPLIDDEAFATNLSSLVNIHGTDITGGSYLTEDVGVTGGKRGYAYCFFPWSMSNISTTKEVMKLSFDDGDIKVRVKWNGTTTFTLEAGDDYLTDIQLTKTSLPGVGTAKVFVFLSWNNHNDGSNMLTDLTAAVLVHYLEGGILHRNIRFWLYDEITDMDWSIADNQPPDLIITSGDITHKYMSFGEYINDENEIYELHRFGTHFPVEPIGFRSEFKTIDGDQYITNSNIVVEEYNLSTERKPGRLRWSFGGAVPQLNEFNARDTIVGIASLQSFQPTDEHNTILIFTDRRVQRLSFSPDGMSVSRPVTELEGIGLQNVKSLITIDRAVIWSERSGIYMLTPSGLKSLSLRRMNVGDYSIAYDPERRELLFQNAQNEARVYNLDADVWSLVKYGYLIYGIITWDDAQAICTATGAKVYSPVDDDTTLAPKIRTGKLWARGKIRRITLPNAGGTVKGIIYNHRVSGGTTSTPTYTFTGGKPQAIPGLSGDAVQLEIVTDSIMYYDIEDNSDGN